jgi:hypothetical protein
MKVENHKSQPVVAFAGNGAKTPEKAHKNAIQASQFCA